MTRRIPTSESLTIEFKSDRAKLSDNDLILAIVCLANTDDLDPIERERLRQAAGVTARCSGSTMLNWTERSG